MINENAITGVERPLRSYPSNQSFNYQSESELDDGDTESCGGGYSPDVSTDSYQDLPQEGTVIKVEQGEDEEGCSLRIAQVGSLVENNNIFVKTETFSDTDFDKSGPELAVSKPVSKEYNSLRELASFYLSHESRAESDEPVVSSVSSDQSPVLSSHNQAHAHTVIREAIISQPSQSVSMETVVTIEPIPASSQNQ